MSANSMGGFLGASARLVAETSDFFTFFHLEVVPELSDLSRQILVFKPSGAAFQRLTTVKVTVGLAEEVQVVELLLARRFVDDDKNGIFAADIAKSFIRGACGKPLHPEIEQLAEDVEFRVRSAGPVVAAAPDRGAAALARTASEAYEVYRGTAKQVQIQSAQERLILENKQEGAEAVLAFRVSAV